MARRILLRKNKKTFIGIPTTVYEKLGLECSETVRRWIRDDDKPEPFKYYGHEVFLKIKDLDQYELMQELLHQAEDLHNAKDHKEEGITLENLSWLIDSLIEELNK